MSGSIKRAFGLWVASQAPGLHVYADHLANAKHSYPSCTVTELRYSLSRFGCGQRDYTVRAPDTGFVTASGKMIHADTTYRLTISAPSDEQHPGSEIVDEFLERLTDAVMRTGLDREPLVLLDTEVDPPTPFKLDRMTFENTQPVPPDTSGEPFLYRGALTLRISRTIPLEEPVECVMEKIHVQELGG